MPQAAEATPLRRLCDVHVKPARGVAPRALKACSSQAEKVDPACHYAEVSKGEKLHKATGEGEL
jgi:hypothetical protein